MNDHVRQGGDQTPGGKERQHGDREQVATAMTDRQPQEKLGTYDFTAIEAKWQKFWLEEETFRAPNPGDPGADLTKPKFYILDMFPYPSGAGLHVGHPLGYCATDIIARFKRMRGFNVLHPMGFDAFGLPAEQYAIEHNVHPDATTRGNIDNYRRQLRMFGFSYDWSREVATCDPEYYHFTQWIFLQMFGSWFDEEAAWTDPQGKRTSGRARPIAELEAELEAGRWSVGEGNTIVRAAPGEAGRAWSALSRTEQTAFLDRQRLAHIDEVPVNWCPALGTVLSNEEVDSEGRSERGNHPVYRRPLRQWVLRITKYAERLLDDLDELEWPEPIKLMQRNWIGRSTGAEVVFPLADHWTQDGDAWRCEKADCVIEGQAAHLDHPHSIKVYTTRPDTLFGATYMVLAPEHPLVAEITAPEQRSAVEDYVRVARNKSDLDRTADTKEKTGVFTGAYALNPVNGTQVPIWVADYVLMGYGTGAIMAVPAGDTRDFEFAKAFDLPIVAVVRPTDEWLRTQVANVGLDMEYGRNRGKESLLEELREAADQAPGTMQGVFGLEAGDKGQADASWLHQVLLPAYLADPGIFCEAYTDEGQAANSGDFDGTPTAEFKVKITDWLEARGMGRAAVNFKLRDWIFSRQKYWGEPFPVLHAEDGSVVAIPDEELPLELPPMEDFKPTPAGDDPETLPEPPLGRAPDWKEVERDGQKFRHDLNTMPQWAGSCWYYLRFVDPQNRQRFCDEEAERYWMPVDLYVGGAEHAVLHLLYARFWHKVLFDLGQVSTREPFQRLFNQGMIQGFAFRDSRGLTVGPDKVEASGDGDDKFVLEENGEPVTRIIAKMSKSLKNVVNPDEIIGEYGADTFRMYEMYMGPLEASKPWNTRDVPGLFKLCQRIWRLVVDERSGELSPALSDSEPTEAQVRLLHRTIKRITEDIEQIKLNTAIAAMFEFVNAVSPMKERPRALIDPFVLLIAPFAPHLAEELWQRLGHEQSLAYESWPTFDETLTVEPEVEIAVQLTGKVKARIMVAADASEETMQEAAMADERIAKLLAGKTVRKVIVVPGRLVNIIAN
jgi:leucyl-tRNA synthetase